MIRHARTFDVALAPFLVVLLTVGEVSLVIVARGSASLMVALIALHLLVLLYLIPWLAFIGVVLLSPLQRSVFGDYGLALAWLPVISLLAHVIANSLVYRGKLLGTLRENMPLLLALFLWAYMLLSLYSRSSAESAGALLVNPFGAPGVVKLKYSILALLMFISLSLFKTSIARLRVTVLTLLMLLAVLVITGILPLLGWNGWFMSLYSEFIGGSWPAPIERATSIFWGWVGNAQLGDFIVTAGLISFPFAFLQSKCTITRLLLFVLLALSAVTLYYTFAIITWIAFIAGVAVLWLVVANKRVWFVYLVVVACVVIVSIGFGLASLDMIPEQARIKFLGLGQYLTGHEVGAGTLQERIDLADRAVWMFAQSPIFGTGTGSFAAISSDLGLPILYAHNSYLLVLAENGILGLAVLAVLIFLVLKTALTNLRDTAHRGVWLLQAGCLSAIVANLTFELAYGSMLYNLNFWLPMAITLAIRTLVSQEGKGNNGENQSGTRHPFIGTGWHGETSLRHPPSPGQGTIRRNHLLLPPKGT